MSQSEEVKKIIIDKCKCDIEELADIRLSQLDDSDLLDEVWEILKENRDKFNDIVKFIILNINDYNEEHVDGFTFIRKVSKSTLNVDSIPFYDEISNTCLLYYDDVSEDIIDVKLRILYKIVFDNFSSILSIDSGEVGIFQKKFANESCLEDEESYSKVLLTNIGISIKDDILSTKNKFLESKPLTCNKNYLQYKDSIDILNEYNNTDDILWKFLLLYQILENFSYRKSIAKNLRDRASLNIKHLSSIYTSPKGEGSFIKTSIQEFMGDIDDSVFFQFRKDASTIIKVELITSGSNKKIKLENIDIIVKNIANFLNIKLQDIHNKKILQQELANMIYVIRNCIVHNKETEWIHINNSLLKEKPEIKNFFENFFLPTMEFIVKELIFIENNITDYPSNKPNYILIWGDHPSTIIDAPSSIELNSEQNLTPILNTVYLLASQIRQRMFSLFRR